MGFENENDNLNIDNETEEIIRDFVSEAYNLLDKAVAIINKIDSENNEEAINTIFRLFHSIKGSAGFLGFNNIRKVTHEAETLLDIYRTKKIIPKDHEVDILYQTFDLMEELINQISSRLDDSGLEDYTDLIVGKLTKCIDEYDEAKRKQRENMLVNKISTGSKVENIDIEKYSFLGPYFEAIDLNNITPEVLERYKNETVKMLDDSFDSLPKLEKDPYDYEVVLELLKNVFNIKKISETLAFDEIAEISYGFENLFNNVLKSKTTLTPSAINSIRKILNEIKHSIKQINPKNNIHTPSTIKDKENLLSIINGLCDAKATSGVFKPVTKNKRQLGEILVEMGAIDNETIEEALELQQKPDEAIKKKKIGDRIDADTSSIGSMRKEDIIRVDTEKLDQLFDLVGELTVAEVMVTQNRQINKLNIESFGKAATNLSGITRDLQNVVMSIRMISLESLFSRVARLVNKLSRNSEKKINFNMEGASTEVDRKLINEMYDPLAHIVRNAFDHGIEKPAERKEKGKSEEGNIILRAKHEGNELWVSLKDDGQGLNREKIIKKAIENGLINEKDASELPLEKVWKLIFTPGFSTAETVSEISGRGVGMDVVKRNIEKLHGQVDITSEEDKGTEIILKIPLTLEIMSVMVVEAGDNKFSIPIIDIIETLDIQNLLLITDNNGKESLKLRDEIVPLVRLHKLFNIKTEKVEQSETQGIKTTRKENNLAVVVNKNKKKLCINIDDIIGTQQIVVKSLPAYMGNLKTISGCSILGNGEISLIIDTGTLIKENLE